ncbi:MAG: VanZ family protein [Gemmatimonadetes bacterium]|nr:VanZ family protein [Gemmatimonadota bacterium]HCV23044.1 VanZ family protein [Candidatus Latescibacterota bacterium]
MATVKTSLFSSERERRLWFWTLAVVAAIYSTLGLAATLEGKLPHGLFAQTFFIGFLMIGAAILTQGLRARPGGTEIGVALGVAAAYLMTFARLGGAERSHLFEYGVLALFVHEALAERAIQGRRVPVPALLAIVVSTLIGVLDESIQVVAAQPRV